MKWNMKKAGGRDLRRGQSLIEMMIAVTALTVGFIGISSLLSQSFALNRLTANEMTATYLASEGIEIAKNLVDHDVYAGGTGWGTCFSGKGTTDFELDYATTDCNTLTRFVSPGDLLWYHQDTRLYDYSPNGGAVTGFRRMVRVLTNGDQITAIAEVWWPGLAGTSGSLVLEDQFYNWYK